MVNNNLYNIREYNDLTQRKLAKELNVSRPSYAKWENNIEPIPLKHLNDLSNYYNISMDYILDLPEI